MPSREKKPAPNIHRTRFGTNVAKLRGKCGFTQEQLAEKIDRSLRYTQAIEAGESWPKLPTLSLLRKTLKCSWDDLLAGT